VTNILGFVACDSAGVGVLNAARKTMARMLGNTESAFESASRQFWVVDAKVHTLMCLVKALCDSPLFRGQLDLLIKQIGNKLLRDWMAM